MKKLIAGGIAALLALGFSAAIVAPAQAWGGHHHGYWGGPGPAIGAGIGFLGGMAIGAAIANDGHRGAYRGHVDACLSAYRSYDPRTDTYLGYDGYRHRCML